MNVKKVSIIIIVVVILILFGFYIYFKDSNNNNNNNNNIPNDYIVVFNGGSGELTYSTYIYKIDNGKANFGFKYINTVNTSVSWGSTQWETKIVDKGKVSWTDDVFAIAKKNNAYEYVKLPNDNKTYSIDEFMLMFSMD